MDALWTGLNMFILFFVASYMFFNPARDFLNKRKEKIKGELEFAATEKQEAIALKEEYDAKIKQVQAEADAILSDARKKAMKKEADIIDEAKEEAARIIDRANAEIALERKKALEDVKQEMITIASMMAGKVVSANMNVEIQDSMVEETLNEIGENTWLS
jgi:F-type H+-transporting ATPase subunit b